MTPRYPAIQRLIHWVVGLMVIGVLCGGLIIYALGFEGLTETFGADMRNLLYKYHKTFGVLVLVFMVVRVIVKLRLGKPEYAEPLTPFEKAASGTVHGLLYLCLLAMPVFGWMGTAANGFPVEFFNWELPPLIGKDKALGETMFMLHTYTGFAILALLILHIGAALMHGIVKKDGVLQRML